MKDVVTEPEGAPEKAGAATPSQQMLDRVLGGRHRGPSENEDTTRELVKHSRRPLNSYALLIALVLEFVGFSIALPQTFLTSGNLSAMLSAQAILVILAMAVSVTLRSGDFDLSIAATMVLSASVVAVLVTQHSINPLLAAFAGLAVGAFVGAVNATLIVGLNLDAFVITLATQTVLVGIAFGVTGTSVVSMSSGPLLTFSRAIILDLQAGVWYGWGLAAVLWVVYEYTKFGRYLLVVGGNREAALLSGVRVRRVRITGFILCGLLSGFAGVVLISTLGAIDPSSSGEYLLQPYAAVFLGITAIQVGRFNVVGTLIAVYFLGVGVTGLELLGVSNWVSNIFDGTALAVAVLFARLVRRRV